MVCYLRDLADYPAVKACLQKLLPGVPCLMTLARVCRPGCLVEIEGIAVRRYAIPLFSFFIFFIRQTLYRSVSLYAFFTLKNPAHPSQMPYYFEY